jgi:methionyl-tRNA synthetase
LNADERVHVIGKGILRFHAIYWPAFLRSAGQPAPTRIQVHPYLTVDGQKLSKSLGTNVDPSGLVDTYGTDALRWFFAREVGEVSDTDFTVERLIDRANEDLANALGNVTNRIVTLVHRYSDGHAPTGAEPLAEVADLGRAVTRAIADFQLRAAARLVTGAVTLLKRDLEVTQPWRIAQDPTRTEELHAVLARQVATARVIAAAVQPIVPPLGKRLRDQLGHEDARLPEPAPAFARIEWSPGTRRKALAERGRPEHT